jgi:hypothetical protein
MSQFEQINLTENPEDPKSVGTATFDARKVAAGGLNNAQILEVLLKTLSPLGKAMQHIIYPGTGVAVVDTGEKMEIVAIRVGGEKSACRETVEDIAKRQLPSEMEYPMNTDWQHAYEQVVRKARGALGENGGKDIPLNQE